MRRKECCRAPVMMIVQPLTSSAHGSTSSPRTGNMIVYNLNSVRPELVEGWTGFKYRPAKKKRRRGALSAPATPFSTIRNMEKAYYEVYACLPACLYQIAIITISDAPDIIKLCATIANIIPHI